MSANNLEPEQATAHDRRRGPTPAGALCCRRKFLRFFPAGFQDETYSARELSR